MLRLHLAVLLASLAAAAAGSVAASASAGTSGTSAATVAAPATRAVTLSDSTLSATFGATAADFGMLTELKIPGHQSVLRAAGAPAHLWSASFVGAGVGKTSISSGSTKCASTNAGSTTPSSAQFTWLGCEVALPGPPAPPGPVQWVQHNQSNCAGRCMPGNSGGPNGGHCDRLPGCGHDAKLPFCEVDTIWAAGLGGLHHSNWPRLLIL